MDLSITETPQNFRELIGLSVFGSGFFRCQNIDNDSTVLRRRDPLQPEPTAGAFRQPPGSVWEERIIDGSSVWFWVSSGEARVIVEST